MRKSVDGKHVFDPQPGDLVAQHNGRYLEVRLAHEDENLLVASVLRCGIEWERKFVLFVASIVQGLEAAEGRPVPSINLIEMKDTDV